MPDSDHAVLAEGLHKRYPGGGRAARHDRPALADFDLAVPAGTVQGLLGPNGAGKTTAVRILATLLRPTGGRAVVGGHDVVTEPRSVRRHIGFTGQFAAVDEILTGRQNLEMFGRLFHLGTGRARQRAGELLDRFQLSDAADRQVSGYSGGMRRRLDLAASMILAPSVLFLDEPTTGLDPRGRNEVWAAVRALVADGTTVLLTTQYLDEADRLADRIAVLDSGRKIADDTPEALKNTIGGDQIEVVAAAAHDLPRVCEVVAAASATEPDVDSETRRVTAPVTDRVAALTAVARALQDSGVDVIDLGLRRPTLDEVFLRLTGRRADDGADGTTASQTNTSQPNTGTAPEADTGTPAARNKEVNAA